jgi:transcriptional regulator with GAF, ATPase, and Fis domain
MQASERPSYDIGEGLTGWVAQRDEPFRANSKDELHSSTDEKQKKRWAGKFKHLQGNREPNAFLGIPLKVEGRLIGVLKLEDRTLAAC